MPRKYIPVKSYSFWDEVWFGCFNSISNKSIEIVEEEHFPHDTGLVDQYGNNLISIEVRDQVGFIRKEQ